MVSQSEGATARAAIDDGFFAQVRGEQQWITLRGADRTNPPLLILSGPGAALSRMAPFFAPWEASFTLVQWDQPGAGATFAMNGEAPLSLDRLAVDAAAVAEIALTRLGAPKLIVLGISGGSILGLKLAKARPDLMAAYVGTGQIVHWARQQALGYPLTLQAARGRGDAATVAALEQIGPPPFAEIAAAMAFSQHANGLTPAEQTAFASLAPTTTLGTLTIAPTASVTLDALSNNTTVAALSGVLFYGQGTASANIFSIASDTPLKGAVYFPNAALTFSASTNGLQCLPLVAGTLTLVGNFSLFPSCGSVPLLPQMQGARIVE